MSSPSSLPEYASFLIRIWRERPAGHDSEAGWCVEITHLQSHERRVLYSLTALAAFLREQSGDPNLLSVKSGLR